ncbi:YihY family inner membrane protein [Natronoarchaeum philippinense]|uniref:YihY family inner membrane protein n=1 Tax=Natronoarchaeum philippinense TaxID=558529 RepID=A0A285P893_NATPI|nr:YihY/virulence factor BrkB family protein [Natronoarchaeum philippinense]SNZ17423.1 YihY family inner membrane protein [Natronoarchaeum philippinense]
MRQRLDAVPDDLRAIVMAARSEQITFLAAAVAYYAFVSLIPLSLLGLVIASVTGTAVESQVERLVEEFLTPDAQALLTEALTADAGRSGATLIGSVVLLWSGLRLFRGLDKAFAQVYGTTDSKTLVDEMRDAIVVAVAVVVGVVSMAVVGTVIERIPAGDIAPQIGFAVLVATLAVVFYPMYLLLPDADIGYEEALPGTLFAALGWVALGVGFQLYSASTGSVTAYGVLGGALLLVTWLYFGALVVMLGAVVNAVRSGRLDADDAAAMDYSPGYNPDEQDRNEMTASVGNAPSSDEVADALDADNAGSAGETANGPVTTGDPGDDHTGTDRQVQRGGARQPDTSEAMTGEDSSERPDDAGGSKTGPEGPETTDGGPEAGTNAPDETAGEPSDAPDDPTASERVRPGTAPASEVARLNSEIADLRSELDEFEDSVDERTVDRDEFESDLKRYVRRRVRRGHARGWGPYVVLLYGTAMTIAAFYTPYLEGGWAIFAMLVIWLSTLGLYVLMVLVGTGLSLLGVPGRLRNAIGSWRS